MRIFITGGSGFIGKYVIKELIKRNHVVGTLLSSSNTHDQKIIRVVGDLLQPKTYKKAVEEFLPDTIMHLAWIGLPDYSVTMCNRNLKSAIDLFEIAIESGCKSILSVGSCWEYKKRVGLLNETAQLEINNVFSATKNMICLIGNELSKEHGVQFYWPRLFFVYGPGQRNSSLIPTIINSLKKAEIPPINNPSNRNDFIYVKDVANAIVDIVEKRSRQVIYNIGSGHSTQVSQLFSIVSEIMGEQLKNIKMTNIFDEQAKNQGENSWADIKMIQDELAWSPKYSLLEGLKETIPYYVKEKL